MLIASTPLWLAVTNCYVVATETGGPCVIVDAPPDVPGIAELLASNDLYPIAALMTHGHVDHCGGAGGLAAGYELRAYIHPDDDFLSADPAAQVRAIFGMNAGEEFAPPEVYHDLADGDVLDLAGISFRAIHTPGHTPGHCCFAVDDEGVLFSGDQLFAGSIGRTDLPGGDYSALMRSMVDSVLPLPDDTRVLPGHGPETTIARERQTNPFLQDLPPAR